MHNLRINILRGKDKIGENLIEVTDGESKILLECGVALESTEQSKKIEKQVLNAEYDAIIITHYHHDHSALLKIPLKTKKIFISNGALKILNYCNAICEENRQKTAFLSDRKDFTVGQIKCRPYLCDHSAYDSYMVEIGKDNERILYTGDYRSNGRKNFQVLLDKLPNKIDLLITEATNPTLINQTEKELEEQAVSVFSEHDIVFLLQSTLNIDRTVTFYRASKRTGKPFIMGLSSADICSDLNNIPNPKTFDGCYTYLSHSVDNSLYEKAKKTYGKKILSRNRLIKMKKYAMQINANMLDYLKILGNGKCTNKSVMIYSMWHGYKPEMQEFLDGVKELGIKSVDMHVSGHADVLTVERLIQKTNPDKIEFVHTRKEDAFLWEVLLLCLKYGRVNDSYVERNTKASYTKTIESFEKLKKMGYIVCNRKYELQNHKTE